MKPTAVKNEFVQRRAQGESYDSIAKALGISKSTCSAWEAELGAQIALRKQQELNDLYNQYGLVKAARIRRLGDTLSRLDEAIAAADLTAIPPEKLLRLKLEYTRELREEYTGTAEALLPDASSATDSNVYYVLVNIYNRLSNGEISVQQAKVELDALQQLKGALEKATSNDLFADLAGHRDLDDPQTLEMLVAALDDSEEDDDSEEAEGEE